MPGRYLENHVCTDQVAGNTISKDRFVTEQLLLRMAERIHCVLTCPMFPQTVVCLMFLTGTAEVPAGGVRVPLQGRHHRR